MDEKEIKQEARLLAIEYFLANLHAEIYAQSDDPQSALDRAEDKMSALLTMTAIPGIDAALSDLAAAALQEACESFLGDVREMVAAKTDGEPSASEEPRTPS